MLETETARLLRRGQAKLDFSYEFQRSNEGTEAATPISIEYGVTDRLELLIEPVPYTAIRPKSGRQATGAGDLEATLTWLARAQHGNAPAFALAGEAKIPTARDQLIGTGKTDYSLYAIATRKWSSVQIHANVSYTFVGSPAGTRLRNIWGGAFATEYFRTSALEFFAEVLGTTASAPEGEGGDSQTRGAVLIPEAAGGEAAASLGAAYRVGPRTRMSLGVTYDNTRAWQLRPSITLWLR